MSWLGWLRRAGMVSDTRNISIENGTLQLKGRLVTPGSTQVRALILDGSGDILLATGTTVPSDSEDGYAKGCLFIDTDVGAGTTGLYVNVGTNSACNFDAVSDA